jgi:transposase
MPEQLKLPFVLWTRTAVRDLIAERYGVTLSIRTVGDYLARWGLTPQKPVERAYQRNPKLIAKWLHEDYPALEARAKREGAVILWGDETGIQNTANCGRSYAPPGKTPQVKVDGKQLKINAISAVGNRGDVRFMIYSGKMNQKRFIGFLDRVAASFPKKVILIVDNLRVHHGKLVAEWVKANSDKLELHFIPSYSPELNPDEYLNRDLKKNVNAKKTPRTEAELRENVLSFLRALQKTPRRVQSYFTSKFIRYAAAA